MDIPRIRIRGGRMKSVDVTVHKYSVEHHPDGTVTLYENPWYQNWKDRAEISTALIHRHKDQSKEAKAPEPITIDDDRIREVKE